MDKKTFDPEKYSMILCPDCLGNGYNKDHRDRSICLSCGGFGSIKKRNGSKETGGKIEMSDSKVAPSTI